MPHKKVNERWRWVLACLVAAIAAPVLVLSSADSIEAVGASSGSEGVSQEVGSLGAGLDGADTLGTPTDGAVEPERTIDDPPAIQEVSPDIEALSVLASDWAAARSTLVEEGLIISQGPTPPPSVANLSLLPVVILPEPEIPESEEPDDGAGESETPDSEEPDDGAGESEIPDSEEPDDGAGESENPDSEELDDEASQPEIPESASPAPLQVNGQVPPPPGGPTASQWNDLRRCESTHNYQAVSPTGKFRGAYQFSQQTWDWVAGLHQPHLVGVDPIDADPGWQDIMAYTLYALRGWDQWPECGQHLF